MMQIDCPFCGRRDETEFTYGGEAHIVRPALDVSDEEWVQYLYFRDNIKGVHAERWRHVRGCGQWFNALRNTATHQFLMSYRITEPRPSTPATAHAATLGSTPAPAAARPGTTPAATTVSASADTTASEPVRTPEGETR